MSGGGTSMNPLPSLNRVMMIESERSRSRSTSRSNFTAALDRLNKLGFTLGREIHMYMICSNYLSI